MIKHKTWERETMNNNNHQEEYETRRVAGYVAGLLFIAGLLLGALAGAGVTLLLAPQSGKKTRRQIRRKGRDLREQTNDAIEDTVTLVRDKAHKVTTGIHEQSEALQRRGQDAVDEGKERFAVAVEAGKTVIQGD
jgi:gas vesicle protein